MSTALFKPEVFGLNESRQMPDTGPTLRRIEERENPRMRMCIIEAKKLHDRVMAGDSKALEQFKEAITTSDLFKRATGAVLDRVMLSDYERAGGGEWKKIASETKVKDFKPKTLEEFTSNTGGLTRVPEHTNYPMAGIDMSERVISVGKFGEQFGYTFEARVNDDIGELEQVPRGWAAQAIRTEDLEVLRLLVDMFTGGPNPTFFNAQNDNLGTGLLTAENLQEVITDLTSTKRDKDGRLLIAPALQLVVGPALQFTAERVLNTTEIQTTQPDGTIVKQPNPFRGKVTLSVLPSLVGASWFVIPVPQTGAKGAFYMAKLRGYETPDLRAKNDQGVRMGGGSLPIDAGSFDDDTIWFRVRHICGAAHGDPTFTFASDGQAEV